MKAFFLRHKRAHIGLLAALLPALLFEICKRIKPAANCIVTYLTTPLKRVLGEICAAAPFAVTDAVIIIFALCILGYIAKWLHRLKKSENKKQTGYRTALGFLCTALWIYSAFGYLWGLNYYADSFQEKSGIAAAPAEKEALYETALYFARRVSEASARVASDGQGVFSIPQDEFFPLAPQVYNNIAQEMPFLAWNDHVPKKTLFSWIMSYTGYTGFYFPFTGEANINYLVPNCLMPATIAHEMAHQRGIAGENEANFIAVLACTTSELPAYEYAGYLLGYIHLSNALYGADYDLWLEVSETVSPEALRDISNNNAYWNERSGIVSAVSNGIYDTFLKGYGQESGLASYGEVTNLLIAYYRDTALSENESARAAAAAQEK